MNLILNRIFSSNICTLGVLAIEHELEVVTLEPPWRNNKNKESCIPIGDYECKEVFNRKTTGGMVIQRTFEVCNVPDRTGILFHIGNLVEDTLGCICVGVGFSGHMITQSRIAFTTKFLPRLIDVSECGLSIRDCGASWV